MAQCPPKCATDDMGFGPLIFNSEKKSIEMVKTEVCVERGDDKNRMKMKNKLERMQ